jgi:hypothetical protein
MDEVLPGSFGWGRGSSRSAWKVAGGRDPMVVGGAVSMRHSVTASGAESRGARPGKSRGKKNERGPDIEASAGAPFAQP